MRTLIFRSIFLFLLLPCLRLSAQTVDTSWKHAVIGTVNLSQVSFTHWVAGGTNSLSYLAAVDGKSVHDLPVTNWATTYKLDFGQARLGDQGTRKTDDEINLESVLTYKLGLHINPYGAVSLLTQFGPGYQYTDTGSLAGTRQQVSAFFDPGYIKESVGLGFNYSKFFQTRLGVALREIVTRNYYSFTDDENTSEVEHVKTEGGFESVSELELPVEDNLLLRSKLELFAPVKTMDRIIVHGNAAFVAKISKYFSTELSASFINEPDISPYTQIKQGLSLGITYVFL